MKRHISLTKSTGDPKVDRAMDELRRKIGPVLKNLSNDVSSNNVDNTALIEANATSIAANASNITTNSNDITTLEATTYKLSAAEVGLGDMDAIYGPGTWVNTAAMFSFTLTSTKIIKIIYSFDIWDYSHARGRLYLDNHGLIAQHNATGTGVYVTRSDTVYQSLGAGTYTYRYQMSDTGTGGVQNNRMKNHLLDTVVYTAG